MKKQLGKTKNSKFHIDIHNKKNTDQFCFCEICNFYFRKFREVHE